MTKKPINIFRKKRNRFTTKRKTPEQLDHRKIATITPDIRKNATGNRGNFHPRKRNSVLLCQKPSFSADKFLVMEHNIT